MFKRLFAGAIVFGLAATAPPAIAQVPCGARETVTDLLAERRGESLTAVGLRSPEILLEVWTSPDSGSWTLLLSRADGVSCVISAGTDWQMRTPPAVMMGLGG